jgi:hypothetical protein
MVTLSRRNLLKSLSLAALSAIAPIDSIGCLIGPRYESEVFGVSFEFPPGWHTLLPADRIVSLRKTYGEDFDEEEIFLPAFQVTEMQEPILDLNPNFEFWGFSVEDWVGSEIVQIQEEFCRQSKETLLDFECLELPSHSMYAKKPSAYCTYNFSELLAHGKRITWLARNHFVLHKDFLLIFNFKTAQNDFKRSSSEFSLIKNTTVLG